MAHTLETLLTLKYPTRENMRTIVHLQQQLLEKQKMCCGKPMKAHYYCSTHGCPNEDVGD